VNFQAYQISLPAWQMVIYICLVTGFMLTHRIRYAFLTTFVFIIYWIFYLSWPSFIGLADGNSVVLTSYVTFGFVLAGLAVYAYFFFSETSRMPPGLMGHGMNRLEKNLVKRFEQMEAAVLEAEAKAVKEVQRLEELKQNFEVRFAPLEGHLHDIGESLQWKESTVKELEENLMGRIGALEKGLKHKEGMLEERDWEVTNVKRDAEKAIAGLQNQLREQEQILKDKNATWKKVEEDSTAQVRELAVPETPRRRCGRRAAARLRGRT